MITFYVIKTMHGTRFAKVGVERVVNTSKLVDAEKFDSKEQAESFLKSFNVSGKVIEVNGWGPGPNVA